MDAKTIDQCQVPITPDNIPSQLKKLNCFIRWRYFNDGNDSNKQYKSPVNSQLKRCAFNDKGSLLSFDEIVNEVDRGNVQLGLSLGSEGLMLQGNDELYLWCIDFDGFAEIGTTNVDSGVTKYFKKWPSYTEISPSGTGFKQFILSNKKPQVKHKVEFSSSDFAKDYPSIKKYQDRAVEIFSRGLFLAMTGNRYNDEMLELAILSEADIDQLLDNLNNWAVDSGGKGTTLKASMRNVVTLSSSNTYSRLVKASLENVLTYIDNQDETTWCDVANALARVYGFEGQEYFVAYSRGDYNDQPYEGFSEGVVDDRFTRALAEVGTRPDGYGVKHLIDLANNHPDWNKPMLEFESPFADQTTNQDDRHHSSNTDFIHPTINLPDMDNSKRFVDDCAGGVRHVYELSKWIAFDDEHGWQYQDPTFANDVAEKVVRKMAVEASRLLINDSGASDTRNAIKIVSRAGVKHNLTSMIELASLNPAVSISAKKLDSNENYLGVKNGIIDLKAINSLPISKDIFVTKRCQVDFDPDAKCPHFDKFLSDVVPDISQKEFLLRWLGYTLTGSVTEQKLVFIHGPGANGKSLLIETIAWLMGDYSKKIATELLMRQRRNSQSASPDLVALKGRRMVYCNETRDGEYFDETRLKELTGGDTIEGRVPYAKEAVEFSPTHKLIIAGNHAPNVSDESIGFWRRMVLFPFAQVIPDEDKDPDLLDKFKLEGSGILNCLLEGLRDYQSGGLRVPNSLIKITNQYKSDEDIVGIFLKEKCLIAPDYSEAKNDIYSKYVLWCDHGEFKKLNKNRFVRKLTERGYKTASDNRTIKGLKNR